MTTMMVAQMPVVMTPHVATPNVFQQAAPPWCTQTPESSPMLWGCAPINEGYNYMVQPDMSMEKGVSKEFLRSVCEPFFDQMLVAVQQALQAQSQQAAQMQAQSQQAAQMQAHCWQQQQQQVPPASRQGFESLMSYRQGPSTEERSTEAESDIVSDCGAFSSILTPHSGFVTEEESVKSGHLALKSGADARTKRNEESEDIEVQYSEGADAQYEELVSEPPQGSDQDKTAMVCRHWKSKGWCRMEGNCKFLHPDHKRGVGFAMGKAGGINGDESAEINTSLVLACSPSDQLALTAMDAKKKNKNKRKSKGKSGITSHDMSTPRQLLDVQFGSDAQSGSYLHHALLASTA